MCSMRAETWQSLPCLTSAGNMHIGQLKILAALYMNANDCETPINTGFGVTNNLQIWNPCKLRINYTSLLSFWKTIKVP